MAEATPVAHDRSRSRTVWSVLVTGVVNVALGYLSGFLVVTAVSFVDNALLGPAGYEYAKNRESWQFLGPVALGVLFSSVNVGLQRWLIGFRLHLWVVALVGFLLPTGVVLLAS
ncbi:hypothetical protein [Nocardioides sp. W7]|uniref:hypothetical protein n=1 Tax=Nocardioides sp. W7 TaxID=2931390 RepID=UPI001FD1E54A|nr:hypothetical protein [Nocardioides sp. W7]